MILLQLIQQVKWVLRPSFYYSLLLVDPEYLANPKSPSLRQPLLSTRINLDLHMSAVSSVNPGISKNLLQLVETGGFLGKPSFYHNLVLDSL